MDPHQTLLQRLHQHPVLKHKELPGWLRIEAPEPSGFALELHSSCNDWTVYLGEAGFHQAFSVASEALNFIAWCYSGEVRVREFWRGNAPQKAVMEALQDGDWRVSSTTGYFLVPFWLKLREVVLTNPNLLKD